MTRHRHTPGPWEDNDAGLIYGQATGDDDEAPFICDCCDQPGSGEYTEREKANARLIAAAPELLEALEFCDMTLADLECSTRKGYIAHAIKLTRAALAKATPPTA